MFEGIKKLFGKGKPPEDDLIKTVEDLRKLLPDNVDIFVIPDFDELRTPDIKLYKPDEEQ